MDFKKVIQEIKSGKAAPVYFFFGEETYLIDRLLRQISAAFVDESVRDFNFDVIQGEGAQADAVLSLAKSYPMMADRRVLFVKNVQKFSVSDKEKLLTYAKDPLESTLLALTANKADRRQKFYSGLIKSSVWVECKPLYENQAVDWIKGHLRSKGVTLSHEGASLLVHHAGTSLWTLHNEAEKLLTSAWGKKSLGADDVSRVVGLHRTYKPWDLSDAVGGKNLKKALYVIQHLLEEGVSPVGLVMDLTRRVLLLQQMRALINSGVPPARVGQAMKLNPYFARLYTAQVKNYSLEELKAGLLALRQADAGLKTGAMAAADLMTLLIHDLIRGQRVGRFFSGQALTA